MNRNIIKFIAAFTMTIDHIGVYFLEIESVEWYVFRSIGRIAFVLFAYMIAEGALKTSNIKKYFIRLLVFAGLIELFFIVLFFLTDLNYTIFGGQPQNVIWPLVFGLTGLCLLRSDKIWIRLMCILPVVIAMSISINGVTYGLNTPYGAYGVLMIMFFGIYRNPFAQFLFVVGLNMIFIDVPVMNLLGLGERARYQGTWFQWFSLLAFIFIFLYNGKKGRLNTKWFFYIYYPLHIAVIFGLSLLF